MAKLTKKDTNFDLYIKINFKNMIINYYKIMINKKGIQKKIQNYSDYSKINALWMLIFIS